MAVSLARKLFPLSLGFFLPLIFLLFNVSLLQHYVFPQHTFYDIHRIVELLIFGLLGLLLIFSTQSDEFVIQTYRRLPRLLQRLIPLLFVWGFVSSLIHPAPAFSGPLWVCHLLTLFIGSLYCAGLYQRYPDKLPKIFFMLLWFCGGYYLCIEWSYYALTQYFIHFSPGIPLDTDTLIQNLRFPQFSNPRFLGQTLSWVLPFSVLPSLIFKKNKALSALLLLIPVGLWQMFWMGQSKALYLELLLTAIFIPLLFRNQKKSLGPYLKAQGLALVLGLLLYLVLYHWGLSLPERTIEENAGDSGRFAIWRFTLALASQHPWFGVGHLNFVHYSVELFNISHPHNAFLWIFVEWGWPAGGIFLLMVIWGLIQWLRFSKPPNTGSIALSAALISGLINAEFSGTLLMPVSQIFLSIVVGLSLGVYQQGRYGSEPNAPVPLLFYFFLKGLIIVMTVLMLKGLFPVILHLPEQEQAACEQAIDLKYNSRCPIIPAYFANYAGVETGVVEQNSFKPSSSST